MKIWKFIARGTNYRVVLRHGIPAEPLTGRNATPGVYAKFEDGVLTVKDEEMADLLMNHSGFGSDFILAEDEAEKDPYYRNRSGEPEHDMVELKYGSIGKNLNPKSSIKITPEMKKALEKVAEEMAQAKFGELIKGFMDAREKNKDTDKKDDSSNEQVEESVEKIEEGVEPKKKTAVRRKAAGATLKRE